MALYRNEACERLCWIRWCYIFGCVCKLEEMKNWKLVLLLGIAVAIIFFNLGGRFGGERHAESKSGHSATSDDRGHRRIGQSLSRIDGSEKTRVKLAKGDSRIRNKGSESGAASKEKSFGKTTSQLFEKSEARDEPQIEVRVTDHSQVRAADGPALPALARSRNSRTLNFEMRPPDYGSSSGRSDTWNPLLRDLAPGGHLYLGDGRNSRYLMAVYEQEDFAFVTFRGGDVVLLPEAEMRPGDFFCRVYFQRDMLLESSSFLRRNRFEIERVEALTEDRLSGVRISFAIGGENKTAPWLRAIECLGRESSSRQIGERYFRLRTLRSALELSVQYTLPKGASPNRVVQKLTAR